MHQILKLKCFSSRLCSCFCPTHWSQVLSEEWRCSWSNAGRWCSDYIWVISTIISYQGATYIRDLTVCQHARRWLPKITERHDTIFSYRKTNFGFWLAGGCAANQSEARLCNVLSTTYKMNFNGIVFLRKDPEIRTFDRLEMSQMQFTRHIYTINDSWLSYHN